MVSRVVTGFDFGDLVKRKCESVKSARCSGKRKENKFSPMCVGDLGAVG